MLNAVHSELILESLLHLKLSFDTAGKSSIYLCECMLYIL
jgi:hypothetical protein